MIFVLAEQFRRAILAFYTHQSKSVSLPVKKMMRKEIVSKPDKKEYVHQCRHCLTVYDNTSGDPEIGIKPGTSFENLPEGYCCPLCETPKKEFVEVDKNSLSLQHV